MASRWITLACLLLAAMACENRKPPLSSGAQALRAAELKLYAGCPAELPGLYLAEKAPFDPAVLYRAAESHAQFAGKCAPLILWADIEGWREGITTEMVSQYHQAIQDIVRFLEQTNKPARAMQRTLERIRESQEKLQGWMGSIVDQHEKSRASLVSSVKRRLGEMAEQRRGSLVTEQALLQEEGRDLRALMGAYEEALRQPSEEYGTLLDRYQAYRNTETALVDELRGLIEEASSSDFQGLARNKVALQGLHQEDSLQAVRLQYDIKSLSRRMSDIETAFSAKVAALESTMSQLGMGWPAATAAPRAAMSGMLIYLEERQQLFAGHFTKVRAGLRRRTEALAVAQATAETQEVIQKADLLDASGAFLEQTRSWIEDLWRLPPKSERLRMTYYVEQHRKMISFLQLEAPCRASGTLAAWMTEGCAMLELNVSKVGIYLERTLPFLLKMDVKSLRAAGVSEDVLIPLEKALQAKDLATAVRLHDAALGLVEGSRS